MVIRPDLFLNLGAFFKQSKSKTHYMTTSESIKEINGAIVNFHREVGKIAKDAKNPFFKSSYLSLSGMLEAIDEPLTNNGLAIVQFPTRENGLTTRVIHTSGEWMEDTYEMTPVKPTPQDRGSAITYQRRYAIGAILSLNVADDDDANKSSGRGSNGTQKAVETKETKHEVPTNGEKQDLLKLAESSTLETGKKAAAIKAVMECQDYTTYNQLLHRLEDLQPSLDQIKNPSQKDLNKHLKTVQS